MSKQKQKEQLSLRIAKTALVIAIITGLGTIIFGGGVVIMKHYGNEANNQTVKPVEKNQTEELVTHCKKDSHCKKYLSYNTCEVFCAYKNTEENQKIIDSFEKTCDSALWDVPQLESKCINDKCQCIEKGEYYDFLEKKCAGNSCCLDSLKIMRENNYIEADKHEEYPDKFREGRLECENSLTWREPIEESAVTYYQKLIEDCKKLKNADPDCFFDCSKDYSCCMQAAKAMRKGNFKLAPENGCPEGSQINSFFCNESYSWCAPTKDRTDMSKWKTYRNEEYGYELKYPEDVNVFRYNTIKSINDTKKDFEDMATEPSTKLKISKIVDRKIKLLSEASDCSYPENFENDIKEVTDQLRRAIGNTAKVERIYNDNLKKCGVKIIDNSGYSVIMDNYHYTAQFLLENDQIITLKFSLFPSGIREIDGFLKNLSQDDYVNLYSSGDILNEEITIKTMKLYDQIISSFKFIEN